MSMLQITVSAMIRRKWWTILLIGVVFLTACAAAVLCMLLSRQEAAMEHTIDNTVIHCVVTGTQGTNQDHLNLSVGIVNHLLGRDHDRGYYQDQYIKNVRSKIHMDLVSPEQFSLVGILSSDSDPALSVLEGAAVTFFDGWNDSVFISDEPVCIVPENSSFGNEYLEIETVSYPLKLQIIGTHTGPKNTIYCPFDVIAVRYENGLTYMSVADSCSFEIREARRLDDTKASLYELFVKPDMHNPPGTLSFGVRIEDDLFQSMIAELRNSVRTLRLLLPVLLLIGVAVAFFLSYLSTRSRLKEFAVMRLLGMKRKEVFRLAFEEHLLIALIGGVLGFAVGIAINGTVTTRMALYCICTMLAFLVGTVASVLRMTRINVMKLMKAEE